MLYCYFGGMGSGKSHNVVKHVILPNLKNGVRIVTNIPLIVEAINEELGKDVSDLILQIKTEDVMKPDFWWSTEKEETVLRRGDTLIIDEAHRIFKKELYNVRHESFISIREHRHFLSETGVSPNIYLVTQQYDDIDKSISSTAVSFVVTQRLDVVGQPRRMRIDMYSNTQKTYASQEPATQSIEELEDKYFKCYSSFSHANSNANFNGNLASTDDRINIFNRRLTILFWQTPFKLKHGLFILPVILIALIYLTVSSLGSIKHQVTKSPADLAKQASAPAATAPAATNSAAPQPLAVDKALFDNESSEYRLVGLYRFDSTPVAVIADNNNKYRYLVNSFQLVYAGPASHIIVDGKIIAPWTGTQNKIAGSNNSGNIFGSITK